MAIDIGPRIGIDGEKEYRSAIQNITQQQKTLNSEMKKTAEVFSSDADAKKKNQEQTRLLTQQIENQRQKVAQINEMYEKSVQATGENSTATLKWKEALNNAETELARMENQLKALNPESESFAEKMAKVGETLQKVGNGMSEVGTKMTKKVTAPITAVGAAAMKAFTEVDEGLDTIIKKTGASGDQLNEMQTIMENLATTMPTTFADAGEAIGEVNTRFGVTGQELEDLSGQFLKFAELNGTNVSSSIDSVQAAMAAFNIDASQTSEVLDILNKAGQDTGISVDKLASDLTTSAVSMQEMGFGINASVGFLANLNKNGIDASAVMTGLKKALQNATKDGKTMDVALQELTTSMAEAGTSTEAMQLAVDLFGAKAGPQLAAAIQDGRLSFDEFKNSVDGFAGSVSTTFENTLDPIDQWKITLNELKITGADIGNNLQTVLLPVLQKLADAAKNLSTWWRSLSEDQQNSIIKIAGIVAAIGPLLAIIGKVISTVGTVISVGSKLATVFGTISSAGGVLGTVMAALSGPVGIAIAIIGGLIAVGVTLYKNWDTIKANAQLFWEKLKEVFNNIKDKVSDVFNTVKSTISNALSSAWSTVSDKFNSIKTKISDTMNGAADKVRSAIDRIKGFFNFSWSLPQLKMPHFSISGGFSLMPPSVPHISVDWYKKAYSQAVMFNSPTVLATSSGLKGFGDGNGAEIVIGQNALVNMVSAAVQRNSGGAAGASINIVVNPAPGMDERELARLVAEELNDQIQIQQEAFA